MTFGRKGLAPGETPQPKARGFGAAQTAGQAQKIGGVDMYANSAEADAMQRKREAFLAEERARKDALQSAEQADHVAEERVSKVTRNLHETFQYQGNKPRQSMAMAYLYWFILGQISMHRFYIGAKESAIYQVSLFFGGLIVTLIYAPIGLCVLAAWVVWIVADVFLIPGLIRKHTG